MVPARVDPAAKTLVESDRKVGRELVLLTGAVEAVARPVAKYLGSLGINVLQVAWARFAFQLLFIVAVRPKREIGRMLATGRPALFRHLFDDVLEAM